MTELVTTKDATELSTELVQAGALPAKAMADALQLKTDGPKVRVSITMPQAEIEKLLDSQQKTPAPRAALR